MTPDNRSSLSPQSTNLSPLFLGTACAVINDDGQILLMRRRDLKLWTLPGGRLDSGELVNKAAEREVQEETGIVAHVDRALGIYYSPLTNAVVLLFGAFPVGGRIKQTGDETLDVRYFPPNALPDDLFRPVMVLDALAGTRHLPRVLEMPPDEMRRIKRKLALRWVKNFLRGKPEPKRVLFDVQAVAVVRDEKNRRILTIQRARTESLPRVRCEGTSSPWEQLADFVQGETGVTAALRWVGVWQDAPQNRIDLVFAATERETHDLPERAVWTLAQNVALPSREMQYVHLVKPSYARDPVWLLGREKSIGAGDTILGTTEKTS